MNEQWIQQMRQKMAGYKWPAPEVSWDEIDRALAAGIARKTRRLWLRRVAAAAVMLLITGVGYWGLQHTETEQVRSTTARVDKQGQRDWLRDSKDNAENHESAPVLLAKLARKSSKTTTPVPTSENVVSVSTGSSDTVSTVVLAEPAEKEKSHAVEKKTEPADRIRRVTFPDNLLQQKSTNNRLTAKVYMSSTLANSYTESFGRHDNSSVFIGELKDSVQATHKEMQVNHRQPVRLGFSLRYRLAERWSVESGLLYTRLSSDITEKENGVTTMTEQRLNYIGLPLNISYELWKDHNFGLYAMAGSTIEKCLDASHWQFSFSGVVGAEYKLTDYFSLYAEPGLGYYFKNGSSVPTIYQDCPLNFNLSLGLRFDLNNH